MGAHYRMKQILHGASFIIFLATSGSLVRPGAPDPFVNE
jgi:hypothetical protein